MLRLLCLGSAFLLSFVTAAGIAADRSGLPKLVTETGKKPAGLNAVTARQSAPRRRAATSIVGEPGFKSTNSRSPKSDEVLIVEETGLKGVKSRRTGGRTSATGAQAGTDVIEERAGKRRQTSGLLEPLIHRRVAPESLERSGNHRSNAQGSPSAKRRGWGEVSGKMEPVVTRDEVNPKGNLERAATSSTAKPNRGKVSLEQDGIHTRVRPSTKPLSRNLKTRGRQLKKLTTPAAKPNKD